MRLLRPPDVIVITGLKQALYTAQLIYRLRWFVFDLIHSSFSVDTKKLLVPGEFVFTASHQLYLHTNIPHTYITTSNHRLHQLAIYTTCVGSDWTRKGVWSNIMSAIHKDRAMTHESHEETQMSYATRVYRHRPLSLSSHTLIHTILTSCQHTSRHSTFRVSHVHSQHSFA